MSARPAAGPPLDTSLAEPWIDGPHEPQLDPGETHVWRADLRQTGDQLLGLLGEPERERAARIVRERERELWSRSRSVLKALLGRYTHSEASAIKLVPGPHGKPQLAGGLARADGATPFFNISHARHLALFAFCGDGPVGVDLQLAPLRAHAARSDYVALARRAFGASTAQRLEQLEPREREREFLVLWTRHEAESKRRGVGIGGPRGPASSGVAQSGGGSSILELDVSPHGAAALACSRTPRRLELWEWSG
jgi:4'-phosphopantetheinyl transferase